MLRQEKVPKRNPLKEIEVIDQKIKKLIGDIVFEVSLSFGEENDDFTAFKVAEEIWSNVLPFPSSKTEAIKVLEDPQSPTLESLGALLFAELWKKLQAEKELGISKTANDAYYECVWIIFSDGE
jgi:hypothetical protein